MTAAKRRSPTSPATAFRRAVGDFGLDLGDLFAELRQHGAHVAPVEADLAGALLKLERPRKRGQSDGHAAERAGRRIGRKARRRARLRPLMLLVGLDAPPKALDGVGIHFAGVAEHMRVPANEFGRYRLDHAAEVEQPRFLRHPRMKDDLQQKVAEFVAQIFRLAALDRVGDLISLLDREGRD